LRQNSRSRQDEHKGHEKRKRAGKREKEVSKRVRRGRSQKKNLLGISNIPHANPKSLHVLGKLLELLIRVL
jgi:hypothetical protein